ncbi:unnamed protein product [[Actinomadura] parvosata subsp. kistnae]|nr:hypothetical protein [Nonomuraea sp. ATCC 55076]SPL99251.1 unnamed protein product [Actinomadura parvosata subsp. kistnae]
MDTAASAGRSTVKREQSRPPIQPVNTPGVARQGDDFTARR